MFDGYFCWHIIYDYFMIGLWRMMFVDGEAFSDLMYQYKVVDKFVIIYFVKKLYLITHCESSFSSKL